MANLSALGAVGQRTPLSDKCCFLLVFLTEPLSLFLLFGCNHCLIKGYGVLCDIILGVSFWYQSIALIKGGKEDIVVVAKSSQESVDKVGFAYLASLIE